MTNEEAKELIEWMPQYYKLIGKTNLGEAWKIAVEAVEKQIPKKSFRVASTLYHCGTCKSLIRTNGKWCDEYCDHCGQAIDWSDNDEN